MIKRLIIALINFLQISKQIFRQHQAKNENMLLKENLLTYFHFKQNIEQAFIQKLVQKASLILNYRTPQNKPYQESLVMSKSANKALSCLRLVPKGFHLSFCTHSQIPILTVIAYEKWYENIPKPAVGECLCM